MTSISCYLKCPERVQSTSSNCLQLSLLIWIRNHLGDIHQGVAFPTSKQIPLKMELLGFHSFFFFFIQLGFNWHFGYMFSRDQWKRFWLHHADYNPKSKYWRYHSGFFGNNQWHARLNREETLEACTVIHFTKQEGFGILGFIWKLYVR